MLPGQIPTDNDLPAKELARQLQQARRDLTHSRQQYEDLFEHAPVGYFVLGSQGEIIEVNRHGADLLQADRSMLYGRPLAMFVPRENHDEFFFHLNHVFGDRRIQSAELPLVDRQGRHIWGQLKSRLQPGTDGI
ncbi:MAG: PAS domain S-box protein, partial [Spirochaetales bacterium]